MNHLDLFSGIGGFALAAQWAGHTTVGFCEIEPYAQQVLKKNFPGVPVFPDIFKLKRSDIHGTVDLITGGFPCQPFSVAGRKKGTQDDRDLWPEMFRVIKDFRPTWVIGENVANFVNMAFQRTKTDMESEGYQVLPFIVPACGVGAPHRRDRVWIVAYSDSYRRSKGDRTNSRAEKGKNSHRQGSSDTSVIRCTGTYVADTQSIYAQRLNNRSGEGEPWGSSWWKTEPNVGRRLDGFSSWLDGFDLTHSHELLLTYGEKNKIRPVEILRSLWCSVRTEENRDSTRRSKCISSEEVLFAYVCKLKERATDNAWVQLQGKKASQEKVSSMRAHEKSSCSSYRSKYKKQQEKQHTDTLQTLSQLLAHHAEKAWCAYRRKNAHSLLTWECGISRVAHGIPNRVDRLKALGNGIVPQVAYEFLKNLRR